MFRLLVIFIKSFFPQVSWIVNNDEVFPDNRIRFVTSDVDTVFHNSSAKRSDTGSYTVQLINSEGSDSGTCRVSFNALNNVIKLKYIKIGQSSGSPLGLDCICIYSIIGHFFRYSSNIIIVCPKSGL